MWVDALMVSAHDVVYMYDKTNRERKDKFGILDQQGVVNGTFL